MSKVVGGICTIVQSAIATPNLETFIRKHLSMSEFKLYKIDFGSLVYLPGSIISTRGKG